MTNNDVMPRPADRAPRTALLLKFALALAPGRRAAAFPPVAAYIPRPSPSL